MTATCNNIVYGALGSGAVTDRIYVVEGADANGNATNDSAIYYDADGSGVGVGVPVVSGKFAIRVRQLNDALLA